MEVEAKIKTIDQKIKTLVEQARRLVDSKNLRSDWRGDWFSSSQLDALRSVMERKGINTAIVFQAGRLDRRSRRIDLIKNEILLELLKFMNQVDLNIDIRTASYVIGKLNYLLAEIKGRDLK